MKVLNVIIAGLLFIGCSKKQDQIENNEPVKISFQSLTDLDKELDSLNALGEYCLVRGSDREYDTIIDHIRYKYVKDEGYDTPVDESKHSIIIK